MRQNGGTMTKFKRFAAIGLAAVMSIAAFAGCGKSSSSSSGSGDKKTEAPGETKAPGTDETKAPGTGDKVDYSDVGEGEGKVLNIYVWNEEFKERVEEFYPGYEKVDGTTGKIGDVTVKFTIVENKDNKYQDNLDMQLDKEDKGEVGADEIIDIFLVEADYALKYVDDPASMDITELGITKEQIANQFTYTQDVMTSADGKLKGLSWQGCPGVLCYNKAIAKEVLGADDPDTVQAAVKDWATFNDTAKKLADKGYKAVSGFDDTYRVFSNNVSSKWVDKDGQKIVVDDAIMEWVKQTKDFTDKGYNDKTLLWSDEWKSGFPADQKVFCYFGPAWLVNYSMSADKEGSIGFNGGWGATEGPQGFFWGGTWICAATGTDNPTLVKDIMLQMTTNEEIMTDIVTTYDDFVNNKPAMEAMAADPNYSSKVLGGQNPLAMYCAGVDSLDLSNLSDYDQGCNEEFQKAMKNYFEGNASLDEAMQMFYKAVVEKYPNLTY